LGENQTTITGVMMVKAIWRRRNIFRVKGILEESWGELLP
jgi:hypothetical protein